MPPVQQPKGVDRHDLGAENIAEAHGPTQSYLRRGRSIDAHHDPSCFHALSAPQ
jgi:hypothetical protein